MSQAEFLTTKELADLLRIKERKVYDLAASGTVPCSRAMGKLLFPRKEIDAWIAENSSGLGIAGAAERKSVFVGSHDPLLDWALRESRCGLATFFDGSFDGLERFAAREGIAAGLHIHEAGDGWNVETVRARCGSDRVVLVEFAWRQRGLIVAPDSAIAGFADLSGKRIVPRQAEAGSQRLFEELLASHGMADSNLQLAKPARSEADAALAVLEGNADAAFGLQSMARQYRLGFAPVLRERFDLLVCRRAWFEPPLQSLWAQCRSDAFVKKAHDMGGYDISGNGTVHFNGL